MGWVEYFLISQLSDDSHETVIGSLHIHRGSWDHLLFFKRKIITDQEYEIV